MSKTKTEKVLLFVRPKPVTDARSFIGLCNFFRDRVPDYTIVGTPVFDLIPAEGKKKALVPGAPEARAAFDELKILIE